MMLHRRCLTSCVSNDLLIVRYLTFTIIFANSAKDKLTGDISFIFPRKQNLLFRENCLHWITDYLHEISYPIFWEN